MKLKDNWIVITLIALLLWPGVSLGELLVKVSKPKLVGSKADIKLDIENKFSEKVESARAVLFLVDGEGKMIAQETRWVIGGDTNRPALDAGALTKYHFVLSTSKATATNVTTRLTFNRVVLEGGKPIEPHKAVVIQDSKGIQNRE